MSQLTENHHDLSTLLEEALNVLKSPFCDPNSAIYQPVVLLLFKLPFLQKALKPHELEEFIRVAKFYVDYEVHNYGSIIINEKTEADKFCVILRGSAKKLDQKTVFQGNRSGENSNRYLEDQGDFHKMSQKVLNELECEKKQTILKTKDLLTTSQTLQFSPTDSQKILITQNTGTDRDPKGSYLFERTQLRKRRYTKKSDLEFEKSTGKTEALTELENSPTSFDGIPNRLATDNLSFFDEISLLKFEDNIEKGEFSEEDAQFIKDLTAKNPDITYNASVKDVVRLISTHTYFPGDSFGEQFNKTKRNKEKSIIAASTEEVHLLVITRENYFRIMEEILKKRNERIEFFETVDQVFSSFDREALRQFSDLFTEKTFRTGEVIYTQNEITDGFYILRTGGVILSKEIQVRSLSDQTGLELDTNSDSDGKSEVLLTSINPSQLFGEEALVNKRYREFKATATFPNTVVYFLEETCYHQIKYKYANFINLLKYHAQSKLEWRRQRVDQIIEQQRFNKILEAASPTSLEQKRNLTEPPKFVEIENYLSLSVKSHFGILSREERLKRANSPTNRYKVINDQIVDDSPQNRERSLMERSIHQTMDRDLGYSFVKMNELASERRKKILLQRNKMRKFNTKEWMSPFKLRNKLPELPSPLSRINKSFNMREGRYQKKIIEFESTNLDVSTDSVNQPKAIMKINTLHLQTPRIRNVLKSERRDKVFA